MFSSFLKSCAVNVGVAAWAYMGKVTRHQTRRVDPLHPSTAEEVLTALLSSKITCLCCDSIQKYYDANICVSVLFFFFLFSHAYVTYLTEHHYKQGRLKINSCNISDCSLPPVGRRQCLQVVRVRMCAQGLYKNDCVNLHNLHI